ncbi:MAG: L-lactate dehydrogenase complex protein LldE [Limisphaerales bacterium]|jgi:L-lactate dehydrogenase complex protein LldE
MEVDLFIPCFIDQLYPETGFQTVKILEKAGCTVHYNPDQTCCGQPACNAGYWSESWAVAEKFVKDFDTGRPVIAPSGSCVGFVRNTLKKVFENTSADQTHKELSPRIFELSEFLVDQLGVTDFGASFPGKAVYHDACGALRECGIKAAPRTLLGKVEGLMLEEMEDCETCCGFGGTFAVKFEPISTGMADSKIARAVDAGAEYMISTDLSCLMHLDGFKTKNQIDLKLVHLAEVLSSGWS